MVTNQTNFTVEILIKDASGNVVMQHEGPAFAELRWTAMFGFPLWDKNARQLLRGYRYVPVVEQIKDGQ